MRHLRSFIAAVPVALATGLAPALASSGAADVPDEPPRTSALELAVAWDVVTLEGLDRVRPGERASIVLPLDGGPVELDLEPRSVRSIDFTVWVQDAEGVRPVSAPPVRTYRGSVVGFPESLVTGSIVDGRFTGQMRYGDDQPWIIVEPLDEHDPAAGPLEHVVVSQTDILPHGGQCGVDDAFLETVAAADRGADAGDGAKAAAAAGHECGPDCDHGHAAGTGTGTGSFSARDLAVMSATGPARRGGSPAPEMAEGGLLEVTDVLIDADFQFFLQNGGSVTNTVADIENIMVGVTEIYERDVDLSYEITGILVRTSVPDNPYTSSDAAVLLQQFQDEWNQPGLSTVRRDVAHLFTGRNLVGSTIGIAFLATVCDLGTAYGLSQSNFNSFFDARVSLTAHEIGHNFSATHCNGGNCHIMCASMNGCGGTYGPDLKFGVAAQNEIEPFANSRTCLSVQPAPLTPPFSEDFASSTLDPDRWSWFVESTVISDPPFAPPSGPNVVELRSFNDIPFRQGDLRSNVIDLSGQAGLFVEFAAAGTGLEAGDGLVVEYRGSNDRWNELFFLPSDGTDADFQSFTLALPSLAYHEDFRIRFRLDGDDFSDRVFVDDIYVGLPQDTPCPGDADDNGVVDFDDLLTTLSDFGPCDGCPSDFDQNGIVDFDDLLTVVSAYGPCP